MAKRIPLPKVITQNYSKEHPFPFKIAYQTMELIQGAVFYFICADKAAGEFIRLPNGLSMLKTSLLKEGMEEDEWESGWEYLEKYKRYFESMVFRNVLIAIRSLWDWYINKLAEFIIFAQENTGNSLIKSELRNLLWITRPEILEQILIIEEVCKLRFKISEETRLNVKEMSLVRNLGIHNRWEVDQQYLNKASSQDRWQISDIRTFDSKELRLWHRSLIELINKTCKPVATKYVSVSPYPPGVD